MADNLAVKLAFEAEGIPQTVGQVGRIQDAVKAVQQENARTAATARALASAYGLSEKEVQQVTAELKKMQSQVGQVSLVQIQGGGEHRLLRAVHEQDEVHLGKPAGHPGRDATRAFRRVTKPFTINQHQLCRNRWVLQTGIEGAAGAHPIHQRGQ